MGSDKGLLHAREDDTQGAPSAAAGWQGCSTRARMIRKPLETWGRP